MRGAVLVAGVLLAGCAATGPDTANASVCRAVQDQAGPLLDRAGEQPQDVAALGTALSALHDALEVRDTDASDAMRGDALVLQLNLRAARSELQEQGRTSTSRLAEAVDTFRSRECT